MAIEPQFAMNCINVTTEIFLKYSKPLSMNWRTNTNLLHSSSLCHINCIYSLVFLRESEKHQSSRHQRFNVQTFQLSELTYFYVSTETIRFVESFITPWIFADIFGFGMCVEVWSKSVHSWENFPADLTGQIFWHMNVVVLLQSVGVRKT